MSGVDDVDGSEHARPDTTNPYTPHHPIPTVQKFKEEKQEQKTNVGGAQDEHQSKSDRLGEAWNTLRYGQNAAQPDENTQPYQAENKNAANDERIADDHEGRVNEDGTDSADRDDQAATTEGTMNELDPKKARKAMKNFSADGTERQVTDPVTHLPVVIHDFTNKDLKKTPKNGPPAGSESRSATGGPAMNKSDDELRADDKEQQDGHAALQARFPPPEFAAARERIACAYRSALTMGLGCVALALSAFTAVSHSVGSESSGSARVLWATVQLAVSLAVCAAIVVGVRQWTENKISNVWETEVWHAERLQGKKLAVSQTAESAQWLNSLLASIWPLINPDLFTSISDTLEDVMQASLPKMVRMVSVDDIGQGSEAIRILGVRWLPTGAASKSISKEGKLESGNEKSSDRTVPGQGEVQQNSTDNDEDGARAQDNSETIAEGMEAEQGDFVNVEVGFAYRPSTGRKGMKDRAKNAHLYLAFYMPTNIKFPVWVELLGVVGIMRLRLQLTPDPPFLALCTMTFLGQPKVDLSCIPLIKQGPNLMDVPLISRFVQSSVDAAMAEYVAPKSLTLDLKDMLMGDDFKKDTSARGVLVVTIKRAFDFKEGDAGLGPLKEGSADPYVTVGWAKFGKPLWATRILKQNMEPYWEETAFVLVTAEELNVDERLRVQAWDSDRTSADDDLGRIEVEVKDLMKNEQSNGRMWDREDGFKALQAGEGMPGRLAWSVGYFSKTRITDNQLAAQEADPDVKTLEQLKAKVYAESERKLREASKDESSEIEQQKAEDLKVRQDELIIHSPPPREYPSGILSIHIHQISGLELEATNQNQASKNETSSDEQEEGDDLPSAYCSIILNHQKVYKTRTKPKNSKPFFNAGCERFVKDWSQTEVHISVRDSRVHEDDPLLGIIYLPLAKVLEHRSQICSSFPLSGGVGYGRARVSMVFRSVQLQAPRSMLGWDYGTVDVKPVVKAMNLAEDVTSLRMKIRTTLARSKLYSGSENGQALWKTKKDRPIRLPVRRRYSSPLVIEFRKDKALADRTPAFCVLWLKDIPDNEEQTVRLPVWKGDLGRAEHNVLSECGERLGDVEITLALWSGLSGYHAGLAKKDSNLGDIMDVLDALHDNDEADWNDGSGSQSPDGDDDGGESGDEPSSSSPFLPSFLSRSGSDLDRDGKRSTLDEIKEYRMHAKHMHRRNRGVMQWKAPRTLAWMKHVAHKGSNKIESAFKHNERGVGVETEA